MKYFQRFWTILLRHKLKFSILFVGLLIVGRAFAGSESVSETAATAAKRVETMAVADVLSDGGTIPVVGALQANQQVDLRPQMAGPVSGIWVKVGQYVRAGQVLVEVAHADLDASVAQANAGLQSAVAQYQKAKNGSRPEDVITAEQNLVAAQQQLLELQRGARPEELAQAQNSVTAARTALDEANTSYVRAEEQNAISLRQALENTLSGIRGAQLSLDQILHDSLSAVFDENNGDNFAMIIEDVVVKARAEDLRDEVGWRLEQWKRAVELVSSSDLAAVQSARASAETEARFAVSFLDATSTALLDAVTSLTYTEASLSAAKSSVNAARGTMKAQLDALVGLGQATDATLVSNQKNLETARGRIDAAKTQLDNAEQKLQLVMKGATPEQIAAQEARVKQAEQQLLIAKNGARPEDLRVYEAQIAQARASLAFAAAQREKAIVRAPIAGTVTYLPLSIGDLASSSTIAVSLANPSILEVEVFVSEQERRFLDIGNEATVQESISGEIREIAPALDPVTSKIRVLVTLKDPAPTLTLGETVRVSLAKIKPEEASLRLPLSAVKFSGSETFVFRVDEQSVIAAVPVQTGAISANTIEILTALDPTWLLAKDARGLKDGQQVTVK